MPVILFGVAAVLFSGAFAADEVGDATEQGANALTRLALVGGTIWLATKFVGK
jgi:hypothetical protein